MQIEDLPVLPNGEWRPTCCGDSCWYAEVEVSTGFLRIKTSHESTDLDYQIQRFGADRMPLDADFPAYRVIPEAELIALLAAT